MKIENIMNERLIHFFNITIERYIIVSLNAFSDLDTVMAALCVDFE
jgi:hypothetical protein